MTPASDSTSSTRLPPGGTRLPAAEALRIAAQLTDQEEDLHAITRVVLALVGADDDATGAAAEVALARAGIPSDARRQLMAALGPIDERPTVAELRASLEQAVVTLTQPPPRRSGLGGLFDELRGRRVTRTALWYVGGSVAVVEAANVFLPVLGAPTGIVRLLAIIAVCGLPLALTLSWAFDVSPAARTSQWRWPRFVLIGGVSILSLIGAVMIWRNGGGAAVADLSAALPEAPHPAHIAVLDFGTVGGDADLASFAQQLQVRLIDGLSAAVMTAPSSRARQLRVLSHAGVLPFAGKHAAVDSLREARRVGTVLDGTITQTASALRVKVRLIDTESGDQFGTDSAQFGVGDRIALLDTVADVVLRLVRKRLGPVVREHMRLLETRSQDAFDRLVWAGVRGDEFEAAFARGDFDTAERVLNDADSLLALAERFDPRWLEPIVERGRLARQRVRVAFARRDSMAIDPAIEHGIAHIERALALNAADVRVLQARGELLHYRLMVPPKETPADVADIRAAAEEDLRAALIGNPSPAMSLRVLSELAGTAGRLEEAIDYGTRAYQQDPFMDEAARTLFRLFEYSFAARQDEAAARYCMQGRQRFLHDEEEGHIFNDCRLALGAWSDVRPLTADSAWQLVFAELAAYPQSIRSILEPRLHAMVAAVLARGSQADSARSLLRSAREREPDASIGLLRASAGVFSLLGQADSAYATLQQLLLKAPEREALQHAYELRGVLADPRARGLFPPNDR